MPSKIIELKFDSTITRLAGYEYGVEIYEKQVKSIIDFNDVTHIVIPNSIVRIASSFVQGFFKEIISKIGVLGIGQKVIIECDEKLKSAIMKRL